MSRTSSSPTRRPATMALTTRRNPPCGALAATWCRRAASSSNCMFSLSSLALPFCLRSWSSTSPFHCVVNSGDLASCPLRCCVQPLGFHRRCLILTAFVARRECNWHCISTQASSWNSFTHPCSQAPSSDGHGAGPLSSVLLQKVVCAIQREGERTFSDGLGTESHDAGFR